ncbi:ATP-binding protein [uncultured Prevotella sp.]|uniref:ATP-binding protein n=1 Tax=uncultured Prevotella sp. TaxID=159272 RepID=UPI002585F18C|nr:ATP-binding protein [uncultured Prevotella sp.]
MYKRKIENALQTWLESPSHKPLVVKGVRQCGKTSSVVDFATRHFKHVVYLDFREHPDYKKFFTPNLEVDNIIMRITAAIPQAEIIPGETCFVFDEIQDCPKARGSLKYFHQDGRYQVMCTGSLLGVNGYKTTEEQKEEEEASIPVGFEDIIDMYPMDFEEWLWANGIKDVHFDYLKRCLDNEEPVEEAIHDRFNELMHQYIVVGGMPEVVSTFLETRQIGKVLAVQRRIVDEYKADMVKYAPAADKPRIRECFESIPAQLAREYKKFSYTVVRPGGRGRDYAGSLQWIEDAGIIRRCYNTEITELPLDGHKIKSEFKVYMADIGLLVSMLEEGTQSSILDGNLLSYNGAIKENMVADVLGKMGRKLYYFHKDGGLELDFLMRYKGLCTPIECKAITGNSKSMSTVLKHPEKYHVTSALKLGDYNIGRKDQLLTIPMYMAFLLTGV